MSSGRAIVIIPARLASTRFPRKLLQPLGGVPILRRVLDRANEAKKVESVLVATEDEEIKYLVEQWGGHAILTSSNCANGTERVGEAYRKVMVSSMNQSFSKLGRNPCCSSPSIPPPIDYIVNVQGDEPLVNPHHIDVLVERLQKEEDEQATSCWSAIATPCCATRDMRELVDPNVVKVVTNSSGQALYFSRSLIPGSKAGYSLPGVDYLRHIGMYAFRSSVFTKLMELPRSSLEAVEELEQLRWLEAGHKIAVERVDGAAGGVDTPEQLTLLEEKLLRVAED
mmetsp:Transcript_44297/g.115115  ORF Transcript_44297/g.115115 Transcript_44297/m.115115 type:complete len:283 (-) Transcript_44297:1986-2834(-)